MVPHLIIQVCHAFLCCALEEFIVFLEVLPKPYNFATIWILSQLHYPSLKCLKSPCFYGHKNLIYANLVFHLLVEQ